MPDFTLQYVYALSDFDLTGSLDAPPDERGRRAQGDPPWELRVAPGEGPQQITVTDTDSFFGEIENADQVLTSDVTIDGVTYPQGSRIFLNYVLTTDDGFQGYSITIGDSNTGNNVTTAFVTKEPMVPGQTYVFTSEANVGSASVAYSEFVCFTLGTLILTPTGERPIEELSVGDRVITFHSGAQRIRWIGSRTVPAIGRLAPIRIKKGVLNVERDLFVSPNHRLFLQGVGPQLLLGVDEALVAAKHVVNGTTISPRPGGFVTYFHFLLDRHQIVWANGALAESLFTGELAIKCLKTAHAIELLSLFPELTERAYERQDALICPEMKAYEASLLPETTTSQVQPAKPPRFPGLSAPCR